MALFGRSAPPSRLEELKALLAREPSSRQFLALAEEYRKEGEFAEAIMTLEQGLRSHPGYVAGHVAMGRICRESGRNEEALRAFLAALKIDRENLVAIKQAALLYIDKDDKVEAVKKLKLYRGLNPGDKEVSELIERLDTELGTTSRLRSPKQPGLPLPQRGVPVTTIPFAVSPPPGAQPSPPPPAASAADLEAPDVFASPAAAGPAPDVFASPAARAPIPDLFGSATAKGRAVPPPPVAPPARIEPPPSVAPPPEKPSDLLELTYDAILGPGRKDDAAFFRGQIDSNIFQIPADLVLPPLPGRAAVPPRPERVNFPPPVEATPPPRSVEVPFPPPPEKVTFAPPLEKAAFPLPPVEAPFPPSPVEAVLPPSAEAALPPPLTDEDADRTVPGGPLLERGALVTETLAELYLAQGLTKEAGEAYLTLARSDPDPGRSSLFRARADRLAALEEPPTVKLSPEELPPPKSAARERLEAFASRVAVKPRGEDELDGIVRDLVGEGSGIETAIVTEVKGVTVVKAGAFGPSEESLSAELAAFWKNLCRCAGDVNAGEPALVSLVAESGTSVVAGVGPGYALIVRAGAGAAMGRVRYEVSRAAFRLRPLLV